MLQQLHQGLGDNPELAYTRLSVYSIGKLTFFDDFQNYHQVIRLLYFQSCSGQLKLVTVLEFSQYNRSDSLGVRPPLY